MRPVDKVQTKVSMAANSLAVASFGEGLAPLAVDQFSFSILPNCAMPYPESQ